MTDYFQLSQNDQREALGVASGISGRSAHLLEKDIWVVWSLCQLFQSPFARDLVFKGGTSLSKGYDIIQRFSEDIDVTYDIRAIVPDLTAGSSLPANRSQEKKWSKEICLRLTNWVQSDALALFTNEIEKSRLPIVADADNDKIIIRYEALFSGTGYVKPAVILEFGARSTGEPCEQKPVKCDAAAHLPSVTFPVAAPRVMLPERTFWEKATAIHVYCLRGTFRGGDRFSRHWYDLVRLHDAGVADRAMADRVLVESVADHKKIFFPEKDIRNQAIDYHSAISGSLHLVPTGDALDALKNDYRLMVDDGLIMEKETMFDELIADCEKISERINGSTV